jgi:hypothetical protein
VTAVDANTVAAEKAHAPKKSSGALRPTSDELKTFGLVGAVAGIWIAATVLFGFAGLITGALAMVAVMFVVLVIISRG